MHRLTDSSTARSLALIGFVALALGAIGCPPPEKPAGTGTAVAPGARPECPTDSVAIVIKAKERDVQTVVTSIPLAGPISNVPEYHDCQRFVMGAGPELGPLVAIFARYNLDSLGFLIDTLHEHGMELGAAGAQIYNYDHAYGPLGIQGPGFSCLYLNRTPSSSSDQPVWTAKMVFAGSDETRCMQPANVNTLPGQPLSVVVRPKPLSGPDVPPVARWDWDPEHSEQYIGVKCGDDWCEIGRPGFTRSNDHKYKATWPAPEPVPSMTAPTGRQKERVLAVKGWYDEQRLSVGSAGSLHATTIMGRAIPHPLLDDMDDIAVFRKGWIPSAYVDMDADYTAKYTLRQGLNRIYMCHNADKSCQGVPAACPDAASPAPADQWWTKIVSGVASDTTVTYRCVTRREHAGVDVRGTVRWRWTENDETLWVRCGAGCCTTQ